MIQDHYGDVLLKLGRLDEAIVAFTRALSRRWRLHRSRARSTSKIRTAKQKLNKK